MADEPLRPIFEEWEADFGRTFVLSGDPDKTAVRDALPRVWEAGREYFDSHPDVTGAELFDFVVVRLLVGVTHAEGFDWILEIHLVDRMRGFGGFYEQLLDLT